MVISSWVTSCFGAQYWRFRSFLRWVWLLNSWDARFNYRESRIYLRNSCNFPSTILWTIAWLNSVQVQLSAGLCFWSSREHWMLSSLLRLCFLFFTRWLLRLLFLARWLLHILFLTWGFARGPDEGILNEMPRRVWPLPNFPKLNLCNFVLDSRFFVCSSLCSFL